MPTVAEVLDATLQALANTERLPCRACRMRGCDKCNDGLAFPSITDPLLIGAAMTQAVLVAVDSRDHDRFDDMNAALDWAIAHRNRCLENALAEFGADKIVSSVEKVVADVKDRLSKPAIPRVTVSGSELSSQELRDLGIDPEGS